MGDIIESFEFKQCVSIVKSTGQKAVNLRELRMLISQVGDESIFHHSYQYFLKGHMLEYTNDFAQWAGESLEERALAERLSSIDPYSCKSVNHVRKELTRVIDEHLSEFPEPHDVVTGDEFYFNETISFVFPVGVKTKNLAEFLVAIGHIDEGSIYYHFYDSRVRLGEGIVDDFSRWIEHTLGRKKLADKVRGIDPFMHSTERIREHIREVVEEYVRADMEGVED
ncbi:MAG: hypothetical protein KAJ10_00945 [Thermodesulfovibrionia bacterium]|nr:hypothetical protein [Thermodesulfovibrionia bacterium]